MIAALLVGTALAGPGGDALVGGPWAQARQPYRVTTVDAQGWWTGDVPPDGGPLAGEARGHVEVGRVGRGHARAGLGMRGWGARYEREPSSLHPRELAFDVSIGLHKVLGARIHEEDDLDPGVRAFVTADLGPAFYVGWMRPWGSSTVTGVMLAPGFGVDIGRGDLAARIHMRAWADLLSGGAWGTAESVGGSYQWSWDTGGAGLSLLAGVAFR